MATIVFMLALLCGPYGVARAFHAATGREVDLLRAATLGTALLFLFTGIGHFLQTESMAAMLPSWVPGRISLVYATGFLELGIAAGFLFRRTRRLAGWMAVVALILFFPANVYAAVHRVPMGGHAAGPMYLLARAFTARSFGMDLSICNQAGTRFLGRITVCRAFSGSARFA